MKVALTRRLNLEFVRGQRECTGLRFLISLFAFSFFLTIKLYDVHGLHIVAVEVGLLKPPRCILSCMK
jgi:hypothetical protein